MINPPVGVSTQDYIDALKSNATTHVRMSFPTNNIVIEDQDILINDGFVLNDILNGDECLSFGKSVMKQLTVNIINSSRLEGLVWTEEFTLEFGVEINSSTEWVQIGYFKGEKPKNVTTTETIEFTAYDRMQKFDSVADDFWNSVEFPASVEDIYHGVCDYVGVGYVSGDELPGIMNRTYATPPMQLSGYTFRDILSWIAEACGCYAKINADGNCKFVWFADQTSVLSVSRNDEFNVDASEPYDGLTWDEFDTYTWNEADMHIWNEICGYTEAYSIDCLQVRQLDSDADINYPAFIGGNVYIIFQNPFLSVETYDDIVDYVKPIWDRLDSFRGHLPIIVDCIGNYLIETGDIISVDVTDDLTIDMPVFVRTFNWNGACTDSYETTGNANREVLSNADHEKMIARNNIRLITKNLYYNIQSGIDIVPEGVEISGGKYLRMNSGSEIDINASGNLKLTGSTVEIKSGSTFDVESTNFHINSSGQYVQTGDWNLNPWGLIAYAYNSTLQKNYRVLYGRSGYISSEGLPVVGIRQQLSGINNSKYSASFDFDIWQSGTAENSAGIMFMIEPGFSTPCAYINTSFRSNGSTVQGYGILGNSTNKWDIYGRTVHYDSLVQNSSKDVKHDIEPLPSNGEQIDKLKPVSFVYDYDKNEKKRNGLIYEDTIGIMPEICTQNEAEKGIDYTALIPVLLKEIQDLRARVKDLEERFGE